LKGQAPSTGLDMVFNYTTAKALNNVVALDRLIIYQTYWEMEVTNP